MRRTLALTMATVVLVTGCASLPTEVRLGPPPACDITWTPPAPSSRGTLLLIAQSVPDATMVPCTDPLPPGWAFAGTSVRSGHSDITMASSTFDLVVHIELIPACDITGARELPAEHEGTRLHVLERDRVYAYTFTGGCVRIEFPTSTLGTSSSGRALFDRIQLMTRNELRSLSGWEL